MFSIFERYVGKVVLQYVLIVTLVLTFITLLVTFVDQLRYIGRGDVDFIFLLGHVALQVPEMIVLIFPIAILLGSVIGLGTLAKSSELVILQAIGISKMGIVILSFKIVLPLIAIIFLISEMVVPKAEQLAELRLSNVSNNTQISVTHRGLWLREGSDFISIRSSLSDGSIQDISRYVFDGQELLSLKTAKVGIYNGSQWDMFDVTTYDYKGDRVEISHDKMQSWHLELNPSRIEIVGASGKYLTVTSIIDYIAYLEQNNQDASRYRLDLYVKLVSPFTLIVMLLLASVTVFGSNRNNAIGYKIVKGLALGFSFYVANQMVGRFSLVYGIPPSVGAIAPSLIFFIFAIYLLHKKL